MTKSHRYPFLSLWLQLLLLGALISRAITVYVLKTSSGSESEVALPDEQVVRLLFWVEDTRRKALLAGNEKEGKEKTDNSVSEEKDQGKTKTKNTNKNRKLKEMDEDDEEDYDADQATQDSKEKSSTLSLTYFASIIQYPTFNFTPPELDVWLSIYFHHNRVSMPAGELNHNLIPASWWSRRVKVSSAPPTYWYLCPSPDQCAPGDPPYLLHNATASLGPKVERIAFGATIGLLFLLCLGLVGLILYLRRRLRQTPPSRSLARTETIHAHQFIFQK